MEKKNSQCYQGSFFPPWKLRFPTAKPNQNQATKQKKDFIDFSLTFQVCLMRNESNSVLRKS